jgi:hypothetical protein
MANPSRRNIDYCVSERTESGRFNTLRVVEGQTREVCAKSLKESELTSSGGIVPL